MVGCFSLVSRQVLLEDVAGPSLTRRSSASHWQKAVPAASCRSFRAGQHLRCRTKNMSLLRCISAQPRAAAVWKISEMAQFVHLLSSYILLAGCSLRPL